MKPGESISFFTLLVVHGGWSSRGWWMGGGIEWFVMPAQRWGYTVALRVLGNWHDMALVELSGAPVLLVDEVAAYNGCPGAPYARRLYSALRLGGRLHTGHHPDGKAGVTGVGLALHAEVGFLDATSPGSSCPTK